ncbi:hypothetical protein FRB96_001616 [Tulasnella sp. 330]|nr:hypothetical protein FRB96_001616 [Tulasnella sp. 330]
MSGYYIQGSSDPTQGSWSWFDICVLQSSITVEPETPSLPNYGIANETEMPLESENHTVGLSPVSQESDFTIKVNPSSGSPLRWHSHHNELSTMEYKVHTGKEIGPEHEIWDHLRPGDRLGVWMNAQFGAWECNGKQAEIQVWEVWQPRFM